ncbi:MAG: helix-turn-helix domain-containing protein, partial [Gammaproteobacteria bacterium]
TSLSREIASLREEKATRLLRQTNTSIAEIGRVVGFDDAASFTRSFRRWTGASPREYRGQHRPGGAK